MIFNESALPDIYSLQIILKLTIPKKVTIDNVLTVTIIQYFFVLI